MDDTIMIIIVNTDDDVDQVSIKYRNSAVSYTETFIYKVRRRRRRAGGGRKRTMNKSKHIHT